jgi:hypothetical protein
MRSASFEAAEFDRRVFVLRDNHRIPRAGRMIRKYTRAWGKLFGLKFQEPLFGGRPLESWDFESAIELRFLAKDGAAGEVYQAETSPRGLETARRLRRRRRETH